MHAPYFLTSAGGKFNIVEKQYEFQDTSTDFIKEVRTLQILEAATYRRSVKIVILKSMIKLLGKYL